MTVLDTDVAAVAALVGDPARCAMLHALVDGSERPAGELARAGGVSRATASGHLRQLVDGRLLAVRPAGRHRYYRLAGADVATALEALAVVAPPLPVRSLRQSRAAAAVAEARSCYDHLAGRLGVRLRTALLRGALELDGGDCRVTDVGQRLLGDLAIDPAGLARCRRRLARDCLDWTERQPHLAGALPAALLTAFLDRGWLVRRPGDRGLTVVGTALPDLLDGLDGEPAWVRARRTGAATG